MRRIFVVSLAILAIINCQRWLDLRPVSQTRIMMDTIVRIVLFDSQKSEPELQEIINRAFERIAEIDSLSNNYDENSQVSLVNKFAHERFLCLDSSLVKIIQIGQKISRQTGGKFDMTIGSIKNLWKFQSEHPQIPDSGTIKKTLEYVNYKLVNIIGDSIEFEKSGVNLDLGGIAKGYAIDEAMRIIHNAGVEDAMVDAGGDLAISSGELTRGKRRVFIRHPRKEGKFIGYFPLDSGCVATSGDYERFFIRDSVRYHHILDPATGYPAQKCVSVTVVNNNATVADALATAIFVMGPDEGIIFAKNLPKTEAIIIYQQDGKLHCVATDSIYQKLTFEDNWQNL